MKFMVKDMGIDENVGKDIKSFFYCNEVKKGVGSNGREYATISLSDISGTIFAKKWSESLTGDEKTLEGNVVEICGTVNVYDNRPSLIVTSSKIATPGSYEKTDIAAGLSDEEAAKLIERAKMYIDSISDFNLKLLVETIYSQSVDNMALLPAGLKHHHSFNGALLEHTMEVTDLCGYMIKTSQMYGSYKTYNRTVNKNLLIAGALLHDIGKLFEYEAFPKKKTTKAGKLLGHIVQGCLYVSQINTSLGENRVDEDMLTELQHIILSSHGEYSPVKPQTLEAIILSNADNASAATDYYSKFCEEWQQSHPDDSSEFGYSQLKSSYFLIK